MIVEYYSDIHFEFRRENHAWEPDNINFEDKTDRILVLAGDIGAVGDVRMCVKYYSMFYKHVIFVPGNHEYYGTDFRTQRESYLSMFDGIDNIHVLEKSGVVIDGVLFVGGTMWSDMHNDPFNLCYIHKYINDFRTIRVDGDPISAAVMKNEYNSTVDAIRKSLKEHTDKKKVVVTHFPPSSTCRDTYKYPIMDIVGSYFYPDVPEDLFEMADYWIYGHSHDDIRTVIHDCKIVSNQIGYPNEVGKINYKRQNFLIV